MKHSLIYAAVLAAMLPAMATVSYAADQDQTRDRLETPDQTRDRDRLETPDQTRDQDRLHDQDHLQDNVRQGGSSAGNVGVGGGHAAGGGGRGR